MMKQETIKTFNMQNYKQPYLQPYKGRATRHTCPECNIKQSFTLYLDGNTQQPINSKVGKCNRIIKCGYHKTPKQFFQENPSQFETWKSNKTEKPMEIKSEKETQPPGSIPFSYVEKSASYKSDFVRALCEFFTQEQISSIGDNYALGATQSKDVIFWQIDTEGKVRTGKIMKFNPVTCKRVHNDYKATDWVHSRLKWQKKLPENYNLVQCFFGEHLLKIYPDKIVAIVESEKTACIASVIFKDLVWLATGGIQGLSVEKCKILQGRNIMLFPDLNANSIWEDKAKEVKKQCKCKIQISDLLLKIASEFAKNDGSDIADFLIEYFKNSKTKKQTPVQKSIQNHYSKLLNSFIAQNPAVQLLIDKLSLEEIT